MRFSMMPTAKKKMGMSAFMRHTDGTAPTGSGSPRPGVASPVAAGGGGQTSSGQGAYALQPAPQIVVSRQDVAASARIPVPKAGRYVSPGQQQPQQQQQQQHQQHQQQQSPPPVAPGASALGSVHYHPMQRSRAGSDQGRDRPPPQKALWEESTVASMFDDTESRTSRAASDRLRGGQHGRHYSEQAYERAQQAQQVQQVDRSGRTRQEDLPFIIGENGFLKVVSHPGGANGPSATTLNSSVQSGILAEAPRSHDHYQDEVLSDGTPTKAQAIKRTKLPHRDARDLKRDSFAGRTVGMVPLDASSANMNGPQDRSPEMSDPFDQVKKENKSHELLHKRSTMFENLTPLVDDRTWNSQAAVAASTSAAESPSDAKDVLQPPARVAGPLPRPQPLAVQNHALQGSSLARTASRRLKHSAKKRPLSLDYDDAELDKMSYSDLRRQAFDYDPQHAALQTGAPPSGDTIEDKLHYYKGQDSIDQHQFFTRITVREWEDSGDWFLTQFSDIVQKMKVARQEKRRIADQFEGEIAAREEAVRTKMEYIGRTLKELKQDGQSMMEGRDADVGM